MTKVTPIRKGSEGQRQLDIAINEAISRVAATYLLTHAEVVGVLEVVRLRRLLEPMQ